MPHAPLFYRLFRRLLLNWTAWVLGHARLVVAIALLSTAACAVYVVMNVRVNADTSGMLSADLPFMRYDAVTKAAFPHDLDVVVVVVDAPTERRAEAAGRALAEALTRRPEVFGEVFYPQGDPFFRRNGLLYLGTNDVRTVSDQIVASQPFLAAVANDPSLRGLFGVVGLAVEHSEEAGADLPPLLDAISAVVEAQQAGRSAAFSLQDAAGDAAPVGPDQRRQFILLKPPLDYSSMLPGAPAIDGVRDLARALKLAETYGATIRLTGDLAIATDELQSVGTGTTLAGMLSLVMVAILLWLCFHSIRLILVMKIVLLAGLTWTGALAIALVGTLNMLSVTFAVLFIGIGVDFSIHYMLRYLEATGRGAGNRQAWRLTARDIGGPLTLSAVSAAIGFAAFIPTDYVGLAELGLIASIGMAVAMFANVTLLPALVTLMPPHGAPFHGRIRRAAAALGAWIDRHARALVIGSAVVGAAALALAPFVHFDADPLNLRDQESESVATLRDVRSTAGLDRYYAVAVVPSFTDANALAARLGAVPAVAGTRTVTDFLPTDQAEKLAIIDTLALIIEPSLQGPAKPPPTAEETREAIAQLSTRLEAVRNDGTALGRAAGRLADAFARLALDEAGDRAVQAVDRALIGGIADDLDAIRLSLGAAKVSLADLPPKLSERWLTADGRARIEIYPKADIQRDREGLDTFVETVNAIVPEASGEPMLIVGARRTILTAFAKAAVLSFLAIGVLLFLLLRNTQDVVLVFLPILWAAVTTIGATVVFGIVLNFVNIIALPLLFGLGVAGSVQLIIRARTEQGMQGALTSSTPRAVLFSSLTTMASFGSLAVVRHPGIASMGALLTIALAVAITSTLVMLPAVVSWVRRAHED